MKETAGKTAAREYFYRSFLPSVLTPRLLKSSNYLLLLGENFLEMELLAELGVPPYRVFSVERDKQIYDKQRRLNQREEFGVALHYGSLEEYLRSYRFSDHKFGVFNLDICGSNLRHIDPALGEILLFARRNPRSVVATYTSAGRDRLQLQEGLKSLAFMLWLHPEATANLVSELYEQYRGSELFGTEKNRETVGKNMVLRHFFWLRSHMEHIAIGSYMLGNTSSGNVRRLMELQEMVWSQVVRGSKIPLTYRQLRKLSDSAARHVVPKIVMDLEFTDIQTITYAAYNGFYQCCYFATYDLAEDTLGLEDWLERAAKALLDNPVLTVNGDGEFCRSTYGKLTLGANIGDMVVWEKPDLSSGLRRLGIPPAAPELPSLVHQEVQDSDQETEEPEPESDNGRLSESVIAQIRRLARSGLNTNEIVQRLSLNERHRGSVSAYIAVTRRDNSPEEPS